MNSSIMTDRDKFQQFIDELQKAVEQGSLPRDILEFARDMLIVGGDMINSQAIIGNNNVIHVYPSKPAVEEKIEVDEQSLVVDALNAYRKEQSVEQSKASEGPYPGLLAYRMQDADHFCGRNAAIAELTVELERRQVVWLHGRSGTGKSSLIQAGMMPALLKKNAFPILVRSFDESPTTALKKTVLKRHWSNNLKLGAESLLQFLSKVDTALKGQPIYLFFDQFEEFIIRLTESKQEEFARELADCIADASLPVHFIFSMRTDYFGETSILRERLQAGVSREYVVRSLKPDEARQVIISPLEQLGITYQAGLVDAILSHLGTATVESPHLQLVCEKLFHGLPAESKQITFDHYQQLGETRGIITDYLKQVLHDQQVIPSSQYNAATYILSTLVTLDGRRDMKHVSDWYADERLRLLTLGWRVNKEHLPASDNPLAMQSMDPVTIANFIEQVKKHVSAQGDDLRKIVDNMLNGYVLKAQRTFVDEVVRSLRDARLLHEIQSDDGELSSELIHDYLIAEVMGWLDKDEQNARQLRNKLDQKQQDFKQHKLLLEPKELEIISPQLGNPKLLLQDSDKRLLLLSAAAHGTGRQWLTVSGPNGLDWLREACQMDEYAEAVRLGAAACLGAVNDEQTIKQLSSNAENEKNQPRKTLLWEMLARYLHHTSLPYSLPSQLVWPVFLRQAGLRVKDGAAMRSRMRKVASFSALLCALLMMTFVSIQSIINPADKTPLPFLVALTIFFGILGFFTAYLFAEVTTSLMLIMRRWSWFWQAIILGSVGSLLGIIFFYILSGQRAVWFEGGIISLALVLMNRRPGLKSVWYSVLFALVSGVLILSLGKIVINDVALEKLGAILSTGIFSSIYVYFVSRLE